MDTHITEVLDIRWSNIEKTILNVNVKFHGIEQIVPMCIHDGYITQVGQELWDEIIYGMHGDIGDYVEPEPIPEPVPNSISRRQFFQQLAVLNIITKQEAISSLQGGSIPTPIQTIIDTLPTEDDKFNAQMLIIGAQTFEINHPLSEIVRQSLQWTVEQRDEFWVNASKL